MTGRYFRLALECLGAATLAALVAAAIALTASPSWLQQQDTPAKADYIITLAGDNHRLLKAIELYKQGYAPKIFLSNDYVGPPTRFSQLMTELGYKTVDFHELRSRVLEHEGIPKSAVEEFGVGLASTIEEAEVFRQVAGTREFTALLVTSPYHARRAKIIFQSVMPRAHFLVVSPPEGAIEQRWWRDKESAMRILDETAKLFYFWLGGAFRTGP